ncbi:MAG: lipopolysaccharide assembly protein LapA domain-containing protein [Thermoleophilia bacterium]|nr:lipopolysaccharide assembly protein LapA domain-containing protein [Thermoleophilia bacterium]
MRVFLAIMVVLLILLLVFAVQNPGSTEVTFLTFSSTVSLLLIILVSTVVGLLLGLAMMLPGNLRRSSRVRKLESEAEKLRSQSADRAAAMAKSRSEPADSESGDSTKATKES